EASNKVFLHAVLEEAGIKIKDVTWLIPHQANDRIGRELAQNLRLEDKFVTYIRDMGNISAASIFAAMYDAFHDGWLQKGDIILMAAVGSGYTYGAGVIQWNIDNPKSRPPGKFSDFRNRSL